jgi:asparagine synthase (glutamine-hydrolysing)
MCGLVGLAGASLKNEMESVLPLIAHRGPDGQGVYADECVTLGHCRLAIIDPKSGAQPFVDPTKRYVLVYNGELYNYKELRERLAARGYRFSTNCDTEVLAYWLAEFGVNGLTDLNGMFAFAFWDKKERRLLLARDRVGIKPLYIARTREVLIFASEVKAILPFLLSCEPDLNAVFEFVTFQQMISDGTIFRGIKKLSPGQWLEWTPEQVAQGRYWTLAGGTTFRGTHAEAVETYRSLLRGAVKRQMISDVPLGSHLSSGLDSSAVATLAAGYARSPLATFTGAFTDAAYYDERLGARAVARRVGAEAHEVEIVPSDFTANFADVVWHLEEPTLGTGALPQYIVSRLAARHVKVVLTGHGGDELFAGYQVNKAALLKCAAGRGPLSLLSAILSIRPDEITRVLYFLLYPLMIPEVRFGLFVMTPARSRGAALSQELLRIVGDYDPVRVLQEKVRSNADDRGNLLLDVYLNVYLQTLLCQEDKVGMAHSLEARIPICDNEMIDFARSLTLEQKLHNGRLKAIPKDACRVLLPGEIFRMPKRGFPTPFARWFRQEPLHSFISDLLLSRRAKVRGFFNPTQLERWLKQNRAAKFDNLADYARANRLYSAAVLEQWHRSFVDGDRPGRCRNLPRTGEFATKMMA